MFWPIQGLYLVIKWQSPMRNNLWYILVGISLEKGSWKSYFFKTNTLYSICQMTVNKENLLWTSGLMKQWKNKVKVPYKMYLCSISCNDKIIHSPLSYIDGGVQLGPIFCGRLLTVYIVPRNWEPCLVFRPSSIRCMKLNIHKQKFCFWRY